MQKVNVDVYIWNELRSNDRFGLNTQHVSIVVFVGFKPSKTTKTTLYAHVVFVYYSWWCFFRKKLFSRRNLCRRMYLTSANYRDTIATIGFAIVFIIVQINL